MSLPKMERIRPISQEWPASSSSWDTSTTAPSSILVGPIFSCVGTPSSMRVRSAFVALAAAAACAGVRCHSSSCTRSGGICGKISAASRVQSLSFDSTAKCTTLRPHRSTAETSARERRPSSTTAFRVSAEPLAAARCSADRPRLSCRARSFAETRPSSTHARRTRPQPRAAAAPAGEDPREASSCRKSSAMRSSGAKELQTLLSTSAASVFPSRSARTSGVGAKMQRSTSTSGSLAPLLYLMLRRPSPNVCPETRPSCHSAPRADSFWRTSTTAPSPCTARPMGRCQGAPSSSRARSAPAAPASAATCAGVRHQRSSAASVSSESSQHSTAVRTQLASPAAAA
mmetsp:Transcript_14812/g.43223  ORF Transcript_14812/g.43223 Transcript_14812/m.43223 type:complete len:344 (+) Transcript_14812:272-1303(+)